MNETKQALAPPDVSFKLNMQGYNAYAEKGNIKTYC